MSLLRAFVAAIVFISRWADAQQKQHYINKVNHVKTNQQRGYKKVNFGKCEEILVKTQRAHYLRVYTGNVSAHRCYHTVSLRTRCSLCEMDIVTLTRNDVAFNESTRVP